MAKRDTRKSKNGFRLRLGASLLAMACLSIGGPQLAFAQDNNPQANGAQAQIELPSPEVQVMLLQSTLASLNHANLTGDYFVFLGLSATGFRQANTAPELAERFRGFRENAIDISPVVLFAPQWQTPPRLENGMLRLTGSFATQPQSVSFDLAYLLEGGRWKLANASLSLNEL